MAIAYQIFGNTGNGGPIDYTTVIATVSSLSWQSPALNPGSDWSFGVRAIDQTSNLAEANTNARVRILLDSTGRDLGSIPPTPTILGTTIFGQNSCNLAWSWTIYPWQTATQFRIFAVAGSTVDTTQPPALIVPGTPERIFAATLTGLPANITTLGVVARIGTTDSLVATTPIQIRSTAVSSPEMLTATTTDQG